MTYNVKWRLEMICEYGCGQEAAYQFKNGKRCCSKSGYSCPGVIEKRRQTFLEKYGVDNPSKLQEVKEKKKQTSLENYRDNPSKIQEKRKQTCLEKFGVDNPSKSKEIQEKRRQIFLDKYGVDNPSKLQEVKEKKKQTSLENYGVDNISKSQEIKEKIKQTFLEKYGVNNPRKLTIDKINEKYLLFSQIEEMRYNPDKPEEKEIQVHCKNHKCPNSKEQNGWFTPTYFQMYERIRQVDINGVDYSYLYCSDECKVSCYLYKNRGADPFRDKGNKKQIYTQEEYQTFREHVLNRDNYKCQYCEEKAEHVHHERPQKLEPFFALDPDYAWSVCQKCHYEKGHSNEGCKTSDIAGKQCSK